MHGEIYDRLRQALDDHQVVALATVVAGPGLGRQLLLHRDGQSAGSLGGARLDTLAAGVARERFVSFGAERRTVELDGEEHEIFVEVHAPPPRLVIVGAVHVAIPLVHLAHTVGFQAHVVDPRTAFATAERFAHADSLSHDWPDEALERLGVDANTFVALLSHDLKLDLPALRVALPRARYVGALGSKKTHARRVRALREDGVPEQLIARIHNPIGLDLGGRRAEEIAVAVIAQVVAVSHGLDARPP